MPSKEIRGPKVGVVDDILNSFMKAHRCTLKDLIEKNTDRGKFYFIKTKQKEILTSEILTEIIVNSIAAIKWKKSMRWANTDLLWGRPLRSILAVYNRKVLSFTFGHFKS